MFDILVYVLEHCQRTEVMQDTEGVARKLSDAGFDEPDISAALSWLAGATREPRAAWRPVPRPGEAHRILAARESTRLDAESHGFLWRLEDCGVLDAESRERVLERIVAAPVDALSLDQIKLVVLMVLWQRGEASGAQVAEDAYFGTGARSLH
jgi:Smg protein